MMAKSGNAAALPGVLAHEACCKSYSLKETNMDKSKVTKKQPASGENTERRGSESKDPNKHDKGAMTGKEWTNGQSDAQRERRHEDQQTKVNEPL